MVFREYFVVKHRTTTFIDSFVVLVRIRSGKKRPID